MQKEKIIQESINFVGKKGPEYVLHHATDEEKDYFEGVIYDAGVPMISLISYLTCPTHF